MVPLNVDFQTDTRSPIAHLLEHRAPSSYLHFEAPFLGYKL